MMMRVGANDQPRTGTVAQARTPVATFDETGTIRIGREPDNDIVLADLWVSRRHAEVRRVGPDHHLVDLASSNGVHHNGRRVPRAVLAPGDRFTIGRHEFLFDGQHLYQHDDMGPTSIIADDITVDIKGNVLLDDVSFALRHGTLLGIVGPSGCGKSTLLKAMTGIRPATRGRLLYDGRDLYEHYSELRYRIGMVPQDDVLHRQLTVRRALRFAASLRFANDVPRRQRWQRVKDVLELLGLTARARQRIDTLSGGQRKRTSVALELLTEPSLLALDEPTSGLDPALDKEVMRELRLLADRGRTVVVVTHSVLHLDLCDHVLVMCQGGRMGYFGPPDELLGFFGSEDYADVFDKVTNDAERWAQIYRNSDIYRRYVGEVALELAAPEAEIVTAAIPTPRPPAADGAAGPTPAEPTPTEPVAAGAAPTEPTPAEPVAAGAAPTEPTPAEPVAAGAAPTEPTPAEPVAAGAAPTEPTPAEPLAAGAAPTADGAAKGAVAHSVAAEQASAEPALAEWPGGAVAPGDVTIDIATSKGGTGGAVNPATTLTRRAETEATTPPTPAVPAPVRVVAVAVPPPTAGPMFADSKPGGPAAATVSRVQELPMSHRALHPVAPFRQFVTLSIRMIAVIVADRGYALFLLGLPLALAILSHAVPGEKGLGPDPEGFSLEAQRILVVLVIGAAFMGVAVAIREIVNEGSIYRRERAIGLSPGAYLASKLVVFVVIDTIQVALFVYLATLGRPGPQEALVLGSPMAEVIVAVDLVAIASTVLGLLASALVKTTEQTTPILVVSVMAQLVLSGGLFEIAGQKVLELVSWLDPSRWGFAAAASTTNLLNFPYSDPLWEHRAFSWWRAVLILLLQIVVLIAAARLALRRHEPGRG
jgi:ABC-type multidrug transport system ATPase subunit